MTYTADRAWSAGEDARLRELVAQDATPEAIALDLGRSVPAIMVRRGRDPVCRRLRGLAEPCLALRAVLEAPKRTYQGTPPDAGNYDRRQGYKRVTIAGRAVRIPDGMGYAFAERVAEVEHRRWLLCHRLVRELCPERVAHVTLDAGELPASVRQQLQQAARGQGLAISTWMDGPAIYVSLAAAGEHP